MIYNDITEWEENRSERECVEDKNMTHGQLLPCPILLWLILNAYLYENLLNYYLGVLVYPTKKGHIIEDMKEKNIYLLYH